MATAIATTANPMAHQNAVSNAAATADGVAGSASDAWRITARIAVPNAPPICCDSRVMMLACGTSARSRPTKATDITGMVIAPRPTPRTSRTTINHNSLVLDPESAKGTVAKPVITKPTNATHRAPTESVSRPARVRLSRVPTPWGISSRPAANASAPRTPWK